MTQIYNKPSQIKVRRRLRTNATFTENLLWSGIRGRSMEGHKFRRQFGVGPHVLDFYCPELRLGIELVGDVHAFPDQMNHDEKRTEYLKTLQIQIAVYSNEDVLKHRGEVLEDILRRCKNRPPLRPLLAKEGKQTKPTGTLPGGGRVPSPSQGEGQGGVCFPLARPKK